MKKIIAFVLSVTLVLNPVLAYAEEASTDFTGIPEPEPSITSPVPDEEQIYYPDDVPETDGEASNDGISDRISLGDTSSDPGLSYGLSRGLEGPEVDITEPDLPARGEEDDDISSPDAVPAALVWLAKVGVSAGSVAAIKALLNNGSSEEEDLLTGILEALTEDGYSTAEYLMYIEGYSRSIYKALFTKSPSGYTYGLTEMVYQLWDILYRVEGYFLKTSSSGYTYDVADMLFFMWDILDKNLSYEGWSVASYLAYIEDYTRDTANRLSYTNSKGYTYSLAAMVYEIWDILYYMDSGGSSSSNPGFPGLDDLIKSVDSIHDDFLTYLDGNYELLSNGLFKSGVPLLSSIYDKVCQLLDKESGSTQIVVKPDLPSESLDSGNLMSDLVGALDTVALASQLDELTALFQKTFPFCIVFALAAIINLLIAPADAPSFDFPMPDGVGGTVEYTVDLAPFDDVAGVFRGMITIIYILGLLYATKSFIFKGGIENG